MSQGFDVIVLGLGGFGSAACAQLARRNVRVLGIDQYPLVHNRGSSHGETRIIRQAYFEHPDYVPLLNRAYELWRQLETETEKTLFRKTGLLLSGPPEGETIQGALQAAELHELVIERLSFNDVNSRFSGMIIPEGHAVLHEPDAGYLAVEACVSAHLELASRHGAELRASLPVHAIEIGSHDVLVKTEQGALTAPRLIVAAGPWTDRLLPRLSARLIVSRKFVGWFEATADAYHVDRGYPCYYFEMPEGAFYGFPSLDGRAVKVAEHSGIEPVGDPDHVDRSCRAADLPRLTSFLQRVLPLVTTRLARHSVCLYTMSPDSHFIIDRLPEAPHVTIACGFSGHGFKFTSVLGEVLADLTLQGWTDLPTEFLSLKRFASMS